MTKEDIICMAREAGLPEAIIEMTPAAFERFAALVTAHEREECIAIAESKRHSPNFKLSSIPPQNGTAVDIANLIRARGLK
jgi:hypothetical protein